MGFTTVKIRIFSMLVIFMIIWGIDRFAWYKTKNLGKWEDHHGELDFVNKYSQEIAAINISLGYL